MSTGRPPDDQPTQGGAEQPQNPGWAPPTGPPPPAGGGYGQQPGYGQGYQYGYGQPGYGNYGGYYGYPSYEAWKNATQGPSNSAAIGGFITSISSLGLLLFIIGLSAPLTFFASIAGTIVSRNGIKKVENGETTRNKDLAQWGFWLGIAGIVLSLLAIGLWTAIFVAADDIDSNDDGFDTDSTDPYPSFVRVLAAAARLALG